MSSGAGEEPTREADGVAREDTTDYLRVTLEVQPDAASDRGGAAWRRSACGKTMSAATEEALPGVPPEQLRRRSSGSGDVAFCCMPRMPRSRKKPPQPRPARGRMSLAEQKQLVRSKMQERRRETMKASVLSHATYDYDYTKSTRDNHQAKEGDPDFGQFAPTFREVREELDHSYHGMYKMARQHVQDRLIEHVLEHGEAQDRPWIVFTAGAMGAGKSRTMTWLSDSGYFPLSQVSSSSSAGQRALCAAAAARARWRVALCVLTRRRSASSGRHHRR